MKGVNELFFMRILRQRRDGDGQPAPQHDSEAPAPNGQMHNKLDNGILSNQPFYVLTPPLSHWITQVQS